MSLEELHDAELVGINIVDRSLHLKFVTENAACEIRLGEVERLVALPFVLGNVVSAIRVVDATPNIKDELNSVSAELHESFFEVYGLTRVLRSSYKGRVLVVEASVGCEIICAFSGSFEVI